MKLDLDATLFLLLLLAELLVRSRSQPISRCTIFRASVHHLDSMVHMSRQLHGLSKKELLHLISAEHQLESLPLIRHDPTHFRTIKMNESLSQLFNYSQSFQSHVDWLKSAQENNSLPIQAAEGVSDHLHRLSGLLTKMLQQLNVDLPVTTEPSLPVVSTAFDVLTFSVEVSERLRFFCHYSKRIFRFFQGASLCPQ